jgi:hypothetical protein
MNGRLARELYLYSPPPLLCAVRDGSCLVTPTACDNLSDAVSACVGGFDGRRIFVCIRDVRSAAFKVSSCGSSAIDLAALTAGIHGRGRAAGAKWDLEVR